MAATRRETGHIEYAGEAQRAAEIHALDCYPGHETVQDELSWLADPELD
jgi:hypothetical protein